MNGMPWGSGLLGADIGKGPREDVWKVVMVKIWLG